MNWEEIRKNYPGAGKHTYLNTASSGLISIKTRDAIQNHINDLMENGGLNRPLWVQQGKHAKKIASNILGCGYDELAFVPDVSNGMNLTAERIESKVPVVLVRNDFPSVGLPWIARGFTVEWVDKEADQSIDLQKIEDALRGGNKILAISWVQYNSGFTIDLKRLGSICEENNCYLVVDGTQGVGSIPLNLEDTGIDVFIASSFKWQTGGYGIALYYENSGSKMPIARKSLGWNSLKDFGGRLGPENYKETTEVIEAGHPKYVSLVTLNSALSLLDEIGLPKIYERNAQLRDKLVNSLSEREFHTPTGQDNQSPIICIKATKETYKKCLQQNIITTYRDDYMRIALHFYNNEKDIEALSDVLTS